MSNYFPTGQVQLVSRKGYSDLGGVVDWIKGAASSVLNFYGETQQTAGRAAALEEMARIQAEAAAAAPPPAKMPGWVLPAALGGGALILFLALRKK
jgi:hypothetical protein